MLILNKVTGVEEEIVLAEIDLTSKIPKKPADHSIRDEKQQIAPDLLTSKMLLLRREPVPSYIPRNGLHSSQQWKIAQTPS
jgi:hypothetical protein